MPDQADHRGHEHVTGTLGFLTAQLSALAAGLILQSVAVRGLTPGDYGRFAVAHTMILVATHLLCGVLPRAFARQVSITPFSLPGIWRLLVSFHVPLCFGFSLLLWSGRRTLGDLLADSEMAPIITIVAILIFIQCGVLEPCWYILNGLRKHGLQATLLVTHGIVRCVAVFWVLVSRPDASSAIWGLLTAAMVSTAVVVPLVLAEVRRIPEGRKAQGLSTLEIWNWVRFSPLVDVMFYAAVAFNLWSVKAYIADAQLVAMYAACFVLAQANLPICRAVSRGFFSYFAAACEVGNRAECARLVQTASRLLIVGLGLELAIAAIVGDSFVEWYSGMTLKFAGLPAALMAGSGLLGACYVLSELLAAANRLRLRCMAAFLYSAVAIISVEWSAKAHGLIGAAEAFCISGLITLGMLSFACRLIFGRLTILPTAIRCMIAWCISVGAASILPLAKIEGIFGIAGMSAAIAVLFLASLFVLREITVGDLRKVSKVFSRRRDLKPATRVTAI